VSLTVGPPGASVRVAGEFDIDGRRGFVTLTCEPSPAQLSPRAARQVAAALIRFSRSARPVTKRRKEGSQ
jgi:hypothetical protein